MRSAIRAVPAMNLPVLIVDRWRMRLIGNNLLRVNEPWLAFSNGYATNCFDWNPATTAPTPATLGTRSDCGIARWQKSAAARYKILDSDGVSEDPLEPSDLRPFPTGQRLSIDFDNWDATGGPVAGVMPYANVSIKELLLRSDGTMAGSDRNENWNAGTQTSTRSATAGRYFLDGFLMAIQQPSGRITLHFAGYTVNNGALHIVSLDGQSFTKK
jgi:hypothetical protein